MASLMSDIEVEIDVRPVNHELRAQFSDILEEAIELVVVGLMASVTQDQKSPSL